MNRWVKMILFGLIALLTACASPGTRWERVAGIGGVGVFREAGEPKCTHQLTQKEIMKMESIKSAAQWRKISFWSAILASVAVLVWYSFHIPQAGGIAVCSVVWSAFSTFMAVMMTLTWLFVLVAVVVIIIGLGVWLHKKDVRKWLKERKNDENTKKEPDNTVLR